MVYNERNTIVYDINDCCTQLHSCFNLGLGFPKIESQFVANIA